MLFQFSFRKHQNKPIVVHIISLMPLKIVYIYIYLDVKEALDLWHVAFKAKNPPAALFLLLKYYLLERNGRCERWKFSHYMQSS